MKKPESEAEGLTGRFEPFPVELTCPTCGFYIELWNEQHETVCNLCGFRLFKNEKYLN